MFIKYQFQFTRIQSSIWKVSSCSDQENSFLNRQKLPNIWIVAWNDPPGHGGHPNMPKQCSGYFIINFQQKQSLNNPEHMFWPCLGFGADCSGALKTIKT